MQIKKVAVLGSGVMGSAIAAHLANAGIPSLLLDVALPQLDRLLTQKPSPIFDASVLRHITPGTFENDAAKLADCDWIIEVVVERLDIKKSVFDTVEKHRKPGTIVSSNTSGIRLAEMTAGRSDDFCKNFLITHFFNPVRYMKLVEIVAGTKTNPAVVEFIAGFLETTLGKGVVYAKDTPSFIANRIGIYSFMNVVNHALALGLTVEAVDKITGSPIGKPKSGTFRLGDIVGLDTMVHIVKNNYEQCPNDEKRSELVLPPIVQKLIDNKWFGDKTGQGFYKKIKNADGKSEILSLNLQSGEYAPQTKVRYDSLGEVKNLETPAERINMMIQASDDAGRLAWLTTRDSLVYAANRIPEIADDVVNIDNAMRWGFNSDLGPFETLDAIGVKNFVERLKTDGIPIPTLIQAVLTKGDGVFYKSQNGIRFYFDLPSGTYKKIKTNPKHLVLKTLHEENRDFNRVLKSNDGASILDLGDGVLNVEFHSKMNAIDADIGQMMNDALDLVESGSYAGLVIFNDAPNFSVGANLMLLWMEAQQKNWAGIEDLVKNFQNVVMRLRYSKKPVVCAPSGMALGGGCEVTLGCDAVRAHAETYIGLVEVGAGLIPGGGGNKNLLLNIEANLLEKGAHGWAGKSDGGPFPKVQKAFECIGFAKVATSALEAQKLGYLPGQKRSQISLSRDQLLFDAKQDVLALAKTYKQPTPREDILVPGAGGKMAMVAAIRGYRLQGVISEHDELIATKLAHVLCAGNLPTQGRVSEQYLLDIEREAFVSLCGEEKSQARMQSLLMTGKPLRN